MSFLNGMIAALGLGEAWNSQTRPPKMYLSGTRVHHYEAGILLFLVGLVAKSPTTMGFGVGLFLHDIDDVQL